MNKLLRVTPVFLVVMLLTVVVGTSAFAANTPNVTQVINGGALSTDIRDASRVSVVSPSFALSTTSFSFDCQTSTGALGSNAQRIYVDNPGAANAGWTLTIAATGTATDTWKNSGSSQRFDFNDPTTAGCTDGADAGDSVGGQMTINSSAGTLTTDCASCTATAITKGSSAAFSQGVTDSITLLTAASGSDDGGRWYLTGAAVSQTIPAEQPVDSYSINLTITATAS